ARNRHHRGPGQDLQPGPLAVMLPGMEQEGQAEHDGEQRQGDAEAERQGERRAAQADVGVEEAGEDAADEDESSEGQGLVVPTLSRPGPVSPGMVRPPRAVRPPASGRAAPMRTPLKDTPTSPQEPYPRATTLIWAPGGPVGGLTIGAPPLAGDPGDPGVPGCGWRGWAVEGPGAAAPGGSVAAAGGTAPGPGRAKPPPGVGGSDLVRWRGRTCVLLAGA